NLSATINEPIHAIAPDPASASSSAQRIVLLDEGGSVNQTLTGGSTWLGEQGFPFSGKISLVANDIPWLAKNEPFFQTGNAMFDPSQSNRLCIGEGIGFWVANPPSDITTSWSWTSQSAGIEQLVANHIISPPGGNPCVFSWDRDIFAITSPKVYPTDYGSLPYNPNSSTTQIAAGWGGDYASSSPGVVCVNTAGTGAKGSGYSNGGGAVGTWSQFGAQPTTAGLSGGQAMAASTPSNIVCVTDNILQYSLDGGNTWTSNQLAGVTGGWFVFAEPLQTLCADRV